MNHNHRSHCGDINTNGTSSAIPSDAGLGEVKRSVGHAAAIDGLVRFGCTIDARCAPEDEEHNMKDVRRDCASAVVREPVLAGRCERDEAEAVRTLPEQHH